MKIILVNGGPFISHVNQILVKKWVVCPHLDLSLKILFNKNVIFKKQYFISVDPYMKFFKFYWKNITKYDYIKKLWLYWNFHRV